MTEQQLKLLLTAPKQAETNIKYCNSKEERTNKKERKQVSFAPKGPKSQTISGTTPTAPLVPSRISTSSSLSPKGDIATLVSLQDGTTSSDADATQEVVKTKPVCDVASPDIRYAKVTIRRPTKNTVRRKVNLDFVVMNSQEINKLTFATTDKFWEWNRDLVADYEQGLLTEQDWAWYQVVIGHYNEIKRLGEKPLIGKGNERGTSMPLRRTAIIYVGTEVFVFIGGWAERIELEAISDGKASQHHMSHGEYRNNRVGYADLTWK